MDPQSFVDSIQACQELITQLTTARTDARELGGQAHWGLGEGNPRLSSAVELVQLFRDKAFGGPNNAHDTLSDYLGGRRGNPDDLQAICETYQHVDADFTPNCGRSPV